MGLNSLWLLQKQSEPQLLLRLRLSLKDVCSLMTSDNFYGPTLVARAPAIPARTNNPATTQNNNFFSIYELTPSGSIFGCGPCLFTANLLRDL